MSEGNGFTNKEILLRLEGKVDTMLANHEERIGFLEGWRNRMIGGAKVCGVLALFVSPVLAILLK